MCGTCGTADPLLLLHDAASVADELLGPLAPVALAKALDLGSAQGFDRAVALLAARLRRAVGSADVDAVRAAVGVLDVDWAGSTAAQRRRLIANALEAAGRSTALIPTQIQAPLGELAEEVVAATRTHARRSQGLAIAADLNALDRRGSTRSSARRETSFVMSTVGAWNDSGRKRNESWQRGLSKASVAMTWPRACNAQRER